MLLYSYCVCGFCRVCVCIITINVYLGNCPCTFIRTQDALYLSPSLSLCTHTNIYCCVFWLVLTCKPVHLSCLLPPHSYDNYWISLSTSQHTQHLRPFFLICHIASSHIHIYVYENMFHLPNVLQDIAIYNSNNKN